MPCLIIVKYCRFCLAGGFYYIQNNYLFPEDSKKVFIWQEHQVDALITAVKAHYHRLASKFVKLNTAWAEVAEAIAPVVRNSVVHTIALSRIPLGKPVYLALSITLIKFKSLYRRNFQLGFIRNLSHLFSSGV